MFINYYAVSGLNAVYNKIIDFIKLAGLSTTQISSSITKVISESGMYWWYLELSDSKLYVWMVLANDSGLPNGDIDKSFHFAKTNVCGTGKYALDAYYTVLDTQATQKAKAEEYKTLNRVYAAMRKAAHSVEALLDAYEYYCKEVERIEQIQILKQVETPMRIYAENVFHACNTFEVDSASTMLFCNYVDHIFSFCSYSDDTVDENNILYFGELHNVVSEHSYISFSGTRACYFESYKKSTGYKDAFHIPVGEYGCMVEYEHAVQAENFHVDNGRNMIHVVVYPIDVPNHIGSVDGVDAYNYCYVTQFVPVTTKLPSEELSTPTLCEFNISNFFTSFEHDLGTVGMNVAPVIAEDPAENGQTVARRFGMSEAIPFVVYLLRDPTDLDSWSVVGFTNVLEYVNMYNMGNGRCVQSLLDKQRERRYNFICFRRRIGTIIEKINAVDDDEGEDYPIHHGGMFGISIGVDVIG